MTNPMPEQPQVISHQEASAIAREVHSLIWAGGRALGMGAPQLASPGRHGCDYGRAAQGQQGFPAADYGPGDGNLDAAADESATCR